MCGIQELWAWNTGFLPPFLLSSIASRLEYITFVPYLGHLLSVLLQLLTFIAGCIPIFKVASFKYAPKGKFAETLQCIGLTHSFYDNGIPLLKTNDNGLLLLSNTKPDLTGSHAFVHCLFDDSMANKGFIYMYFGAMHCLVLTTHLQARGSGKERVQQIQVCIKLAL